MAGLFIELYQDEDVSVLVADILRGRGFSVTTTRDEGQLGRSDAEQLAYAVSQARTFLTHNRADFETLAREYLAEGRDHSGNILAQHNPPYEIVRRLTRLLDQVTADEIRNQVRYI